MTRLLDLPMLSRIRRNHGLEHATIHMLSKKFQRTPIAGRADGGGFFILGQLPTEAIADAAQEALQRLQAGERHLAIHPNCGTNLLTAGTLASLASFFTLFGGADRNWRQRLERLPLAITATFFALILAQPMGAAAQRHLTTSGDPEQLQILRVRCLRRSRTTIHRVITQG
jgi:hypothetical protein